MAAVQVKPWELKAGDRILGTSLIIRGVCTYSETALGGDMERQRYTYPIRHNVTGVETTIAYAGDSPNPTVLRDEPAQPQ